MHKIEREHREYVANRAMWKKYWDLYIGGERFRESAGEYLIRRNREPMEVYTERLNRTFYENYIGSIIDWYAATLVRREPVVTIEGGNEAGKKFFDGFLYDCDRKGTNFSEFFRDRLVASLVLGRSYLSIEFPKTVRQPLTRAEEDAVGRSRAYLVPWDADQITNWCRSEDGSLDWIVIRSQELKQATLGDAGPSEVTRWIYYDREEFGIYERIGAPGGDIRLVDQGRHALAAQRRVPVFELRVSEGLWLMNKSALLQLEHFNKSNALAWALTMGLFAMPVIYSEREFKQVVGESYYIQLGPEDKFGWTEPEGHVYQIAIDNLDRLKDEIYRICYMMAQASGSRAADVAQTGISKQRDFSITQQVLRVYGDAVKDTMGQVLGAISTARQDGLSVHVSGMDEFDIGDFSNELDDARKLLELGIQSETLRKEMFKKLAQKYLCDARPEIKSRIDAEIDASFAR
ncbi:MAG: DUF4055 domain-containing protein [Bryobacterales bacterium]|nr:DUF4055 domain-containing protein [Bryobacterales bacterium]